MNKKVSNYNTLICFIASLLVVLKLYSGNNMYLWLFIILVSIGMILSKQTYRIEYLLFFISWVYVIKFELGQYSLFVFISISYILLSIVDFFSTKTKVSYRLLLRFSLFVIYAISVSLIGRGNLIIISGFVLNYCVIYFAVNSIKTNQFKRYCYTYAYGLITASLVRLASYYIPKLDIFFYNMTSIYTINYSGTLNIRFAGLDLDPNYFSLQVLVSISSLLVLIFYEKSEIKKLTFLTVPLAIFGIMSFSKMFIISFIVLLFIALIIFYKDYANFIAQFYWKIIIVMILGAYLFNKYIFQIYWIRFFGIGTSLNSITTGRVNKWMIFEREILVNLKVFVFGAGYGTDFLYGTIAHNMYLTAFYYMGVIGLFLTLINLNGMYKVLKHKTTPFQKTPKFNILSINQLPLYILLIANFALDSFVMDYFPLQLLLVILSLLYKNRSSMHGRL